MVDKGLQRMRSRQILGPRGIGYDVHTHESRGRTFDLIIGVKEPEPSRFLHPLFPTEFLEKEICPVGLEVKAPKKVKSRSSISQSFLLVMEMSPQVVLCWILLVLILRFFHPEARA